MKVKEDVPPLPSSLFRFSIVYNSKVKAGAKITMLFPRLN